MTGESDFESAPCSVIEPARESPRMPRAHACFRLDVPVPLDVSGEGDVRELWRRLSYRIVREPSDLLAHTRRVLLCRHGTLRERLPGALLDLDHAVGGCGRALRRRLLEAVRPCLDEGQALRFEALLDGPLPAGTPPLPDAGRVLPSLRAAGRVSALGAGRDR